MTTQSEFSSNDLVLRMVEGARQGALLPVSTQKCLLGYDINQPNDESCHCAILRGPAGAALQSLGFDVSVNGHRVENEWLKEGDQIQVGATKLEVVQLGAYACEYENETVTQEPTGNETSEIADPEPQEVTEPDQTQPSDPVADMAHAVETIFSPLTEVSVSTSHDDPQPSTTGFSHGPKSLGTAEIGDALASVENVETSTADLGKLISNESDQTNDARSDEAESTCDREQKSQTNPPSETGVTLGLVESALESISIDCCDKDSPCSKTEEPTAEERLREAFSQRREEMAEAADNEPELVSDDPQPSEPENETVAEVLARMQNLGQLESFEGLRDGPDETNIDPQPEESLESTVEPILEPDPINENDSRNAQDDVDNASSVQDYMNRLLGKTGSENVDSTKPKTADSTAAPEAAAKKKIQPVELLKASEYKPSKSAPEKSKNLDAMRELANQNNRFAIKNSNRRRAKTIAMTNFGLMGFSLGLGGLLLSQSSGWTDMMMWLGVATFALSFVLGVIGAKALIQAK